ncbi:MAG: hypothetical protein CBD62_00520 [Candidatus Pelagibacter sp. TMED202]|nr:MAG: hypothetical protein CBD62_00520 [Candidatus Pelagibacter sp. TMED202]|tara:strand:+ start:872 stop:2023 length:1152 start_codon:yes stop_codon:yes gene_type:complete
MAVNRAFHTNNVAALTTEQNLYRDLVKEAIQIYGHDVYYVDRTTVALDSILGEDSLSKYTTRHPIEMYVEDAEGGYQGEKEIITQFGLENRNEITFVVSKQRFQQMDSQITLEDATDTTGGSVLLEAGSISRLSLSAVLDTPIKSFVQLNGTDSSSSNSGDKIIQENDKDSFILSEESGSEFYLLSDTATTDADRPQEGDLVYHPTFSKVFEISFVDHDEPFYQLDNNPVYKLRCRQFEYSQEVIDTGIAEIDEIEDDLSKNPLDSQFTLEQSSAVNENIRIFHSAHEEGLLLLDGTDGSSTDTGDNVLFENDSTSVGENILLEGTGADGETASYLIQEDVIVGDYTTRGSQDKTAQNELFDSLDDDVLDFSESNPFGDAGGT